MRKIAGIIAFVFFLSGCGSAANSNLPSTPAAVVDPAVATLKDTVGNPDTVTYSAKIPRERALAAVTDYSPITGKFFEDENGFNLLTSYTSEETEAGSNAGAALGKIPDGRSVRFQITSRDEAGKRRKLIAEYVGDSSNTVDGRVDFSAKLPEEPNANYLLSMEILSPEDVVEDTFITPIFVPPYELNARLTVKQPAENADNTELSLYNAGPTDLYFGYGYQIYRKGSGGWIAVPSDLTVPAMGIQLKPGETFNETAYFPRKLEPGLYRLVKYVSANNTDLTANLAADFKV